MTVAVVIAAAVVILILGNLAAALRTTALRRVYEQGWKDGRRNYHPAGATPWVQDRATKEDSR